MTTLKTPEEASKCFRTVVDKARARIMVTEDRQAIATLLCELLEGEKAAVKDLYPNADVTIPTDLLATMVEGKEKYNQALTKAQAIIRQTLEGKQE